MVVGTKIGVRVLRVNEPVKQGEISEKLTPMVRFVPPVTVLRASVSGLLVGLISEKDWLASRLFVIDRVPTREVDRSRGVHTLGSTLVIRTVRVRLWKFRLSSTSTVPLPSVSCFVEAVPLSTKVEVVGTLPPPTQVVLCGVVTVKVLLNVDSFTKLLLVSLVVRDVRLVNVMAKLANVPVVLKEPLMICEASFRLSPLISMSV